MECNYHHKITLRRLNSPIWINYWRTSPDLIRNCSILDKIVVAESPSQHRNGKYYYELKQLENVYRLDGMLWCDCDIFKLDLIQVEKRTQAKRFVTIEWTVQSHGQQGCRWTKCVLLRHSLSLVAFGCSIKFGNWRQDRNSTHFAEITSLILYTVIGNTLITRSFLRADCNLN